MERGVQRLKSNLKYRTTECPEKLFAHDLMVDMALARMRHTQGGELTPDAADSPVGLA